MTIWVIKIIMQGQKTLQTTRQMDSCVRGYEKVSAVGSHLTLQLIF